MTTGASFENVYELLEHTVATRGDGPAYFERGPDGGWRATTWRELKELADRFGLALCAAGASGPEQAVCVLSANRLLWPVADLGAIAAGALSVGIYPTSSAEQCEYIINHARARMIVVDSEEQLRKVLAVRERVPTLTTVVTREPPRAAQVCGSLELVGWEELLERGARARGACWQRYQEVAHRSRRDDVVIVVYTSGTTGNPKGACLSNRYVLASAEALGALVAETLASYPDEVRARLEGETLVTLSFLPYCHVAERISGMYARLYSGSAAYLVDDPARTYPTLLEVSPHSFGAVPRFFEKIHAKVRGEIEAGRGYDRAEVERAMALAREQRRLRAEGQALPDELAREHAALDERVGARVRASFGARILTLSSGAAPIPGEVLEFFELAGGIPILEAYGLTELICCAFSTPRAHRASSVGRAMKGCEIRIAPEDGEILLRGPQMFSGYLHDPEATAEVIDADRWLHTGDIGRLDEDGFLYITGRKKEFIKTSTGKKIAPLAIENLCKRHHLISNVMVYGDNRKYLVALFTLSAPELAGFANALELGESDYRALTRHPAIRRIVDETIASVNAELSRTEQIRRFAVLDSDFSVESYEITPTGKVKRNVVAERYRERIEALYAEGAEP
jgi:long-chain acyl-CoA synthetase